MATISIFIDTPNLGAGGIIWVDREVTIAGRIGAFLGSMTSLTLSFAGGVTVPVTVPRGMGAGLAGGSWSWSGFVPTAIRPGEPFGVTVTATGNQSTWFGGPGAPVSGSVSFTLWLLAITPQLTTQFQTPQLTSAPTLPFTITGTLTEGPSPSPLYFPVLEYQIGSGWPAAVTVGTGGAWSIPLNLAPGEYPIVITAQDAYASQAVFRKTLTVFHYDPPPNNPSLPKTLTGISTSASITSWTRLEPQAGGADVGETSAARLFDPLWLLTRQWQVGEFQGEDAGTPVQARVRATTGNLSRYHTGELTAANVQSLRYAPNQAPLEAVAERRTMRPVRTTDLRMLPLAIDAGLHLLRMLELDPVGAKYRQAFLTKYPLAPLTPQQAAATDPEAVRLMAMAAGRAPDARAMALALSGARQPTPFAFDAALLVAPADAPALQLLIAAWLNYYAGLFSEPGGDAWVPERLEYALSAATRFSATAGDDLTLTAAEFDGGRLDWSSFDVSDALKLDTVGDRSFATVTAVAVPAPITFKGAPAPRFWEMEDAKIGYGLLPVGPPDLAHLMMFEYAHSYGNDWFVIPLTLPVGSITRTNSLVVTDTFGVRSLLRPMGDPTMDDPCFSMWQPAKLRPAGADKTRPLAGHFLLAPALGGVIDGPLLEDVLFMRDEMANLAWGIERAIEGGAGTSVSLSSGLAPPVTLPPLAAGAPPRYGLETTIADNWTPLMPVQVDDTGAVRLRRAATLQIDGTHKPHVARGSVLNAAASLALFDEEVPREGVRITKRRRMARWIDGVTVVWTAYRNEVGVGEGSAGLLFDQVEGPPGA